MEKTRHTPTPYHVAHNTDCRDGDTLNAIPTIYSGTTPIAKMRVLDRPKLADAEGEMLANAEFIVLACNAHQDLVDACSYGGIGMDTIIMLHNAAGVMEELGRRYDIESCLQYAAGLREKGRREYATLAKIQK